MNLPMHIGPALNRCCSELLVDRAIGGDRHSPDPVGKWGGRRNGRYRLGSQPGALPPREGRRSDLPRRNVGIAGGRRKCPLAIIAMSPLHRRRIRSAHIGSKGRSGSRRLGDSQRRVCQVAGGPPLVPRFTPAGNFALHRRVEQDPARGRLRFRSHSDDRAEAEAATVVVQRENEHPLDIFFLLVLGAVVLHKGPPQHAHTHAGDACGGLGQPNLSEFPDQYR